MIDPPYVGLLDCHLAAHGFFAAQGFFAAHGFPVFFFAPDVFTAQGFFAAHGLAPAFDAAGLAAHGLHGFAAFATGALSASETNPVATSDLISDFPCKFMERSPVWYGFDEGCMTNRTAAAVVSAGAANHPVVREYGMRSHASWSGRPVIQGEPYSARIFLRAEPVGGNHRIIKAI